MSATTSSLFAAARARQALLQSGLPHDAEMAFASSTRNEVVLCGDYVVRVNREPNQRLHREARWCQSLPIRSWAPRVVAYGGEVGADYLIVVRRPGQPLSRCWPSMSRDDRRRAIRQLSAALGDLHQTPVPRTIADLHRTTHLLDPHSLNPAAPMFNAIELLRSKPFVDRGMFDQIEALLHSIGDSVADYSDATMIHGDLTFENVLWDGTEISALLDFEWSRGAPADLDLDIILRYCALPFAHVPAEYADQQRTADYAEVPAWLASDLPELFEMPRLRDRLTVYAIAFDLNELVDEPPTKHRQDLGPLHPLNRLADILNGGGRLHRALGRSGLTV